MSEAQTSALIRDRDKAKDCEARRRRPLVQYVVRSETVSESTIYHVERSAAGSKPSHWMIERPVYVGFANTLELARRHVPPGFKRMDRRKDDPASLVEVWI